MREITRLMIREYNIKKLGYDFMGYSFTNINSLSFHHLIVPHRECKNLHIEKDGYTKWNGAILVQDTSHSYLHIIEQYDRDMFEFITDLMIKENTKGIDTGILKDISSALKDFERRYIEQVNRSGKKLIKDSFINNRLF